MIRFFKGCLPRILLGPFLNILFQMPFWYLSLSEPGIVSSIFNESKFSKQHADILYLKVLMYWIRNTGWYHRQLEYWKILFQPAFTYSIIEAIETPELCVKSVQSRQYRTLEWHQFFLVKCFHEKDIRQSFTL